MILDEIPSLFTDTFGIRKNRRHRRIGHGVDPDRLYVNTRRLRIEDDCRILRQSTCSGPRHHRCQRRKISEASERRVHRFTSAEQIALEFVPGAVARSQLPGHFFKEPVDVGFIDSFGEGLTAEGLPIFLHHDFGNEAVVLVAASPHLHLKSLDERLHGKSGQRRTHRLDQSTPEFVLVVDGTVGENLGRLAVRKNPKAGKNDGKKKTGERTVSATFHHVIEFPALVKRGGILTKRTSRGKLEFELGRQHGVSRSCTD